MSMTPPETDVRLATAQSASSTIGTNQNWKRRHVLENKCGMREVYRLSAFDLHVWLAVDARTRKH